MTIRVVFAIVLFIFSSLTTAIGQLQEVKIPDADFKKNSLGLSLGFHHSQSQDLLFSPMIYDGQSLLAIELFYQRRSQQGLHLLKIAFDRISVESTELLTFPFFDSPIKRKSSSATFVNLKYAYARQIMQKERINLFLGGMLDNQIHAVQYNFAEYDDIGYLISYALSVWLRGEYRINQTQSLNLETSFPLAYFLSRPPYAIVDNEGIQSDGGFGYAHERGAWHALNGFVKLHLLLSYSNSLSSNFDLLLSYQFDYLRATEPVKLSLVKNSFDVGLAFKF